MEKYKFETRAFCPFHAASDQAKGWKETKIVLVAVVNGKIFMRDKDNNSYRANTKWKERHPLRSMSIDEWLAMKGAVKASFRGGPRVFPHH